MDSSRYDIVNDGTGFDVLRVHLEPGSSEFYSEVGAFVSSDPWIDLKTVSGMSSSKGGLFAGLSKVISGENFFNLKYTNRSLEDIGEIIISPNVFGGMRAIDLNTIPEREIIVRRKAYFAHLERRDPITIKAYGPRDIMALFNTGLLAKISGDGVVFIAGSGLIIERTLLDGENIIIDADNLLFYEKKMDPVNVFKGLKNSFLGRDGILLKLHGPGTYAVSSHYGLQSGGVSYSSGISFLT